MAVRYGTVRKYGTVRSKFKPKLRYVGTVSFKKYASVRYIGTVRLTLQGTDTNYEVLTLLTPEKRYSWWSTERFTLIISQKYGT